MSFFFVEELIDFKLNFKIIYGKIRFFTENYWIMIKIRPNCYGKNSDFEC